MRFSPRFLSLLLRSLIKGVFEQSRSTRSEAFPLTPWRYQICVAKCLILIVTICLKIWAKLLPQNKKLQLRLTCIIEKMSLFKLPDMTALLSPSLVVSAPAQAVKFHKNLGHFKYSLWVNMKNILGKYSSFFRPSTWNYLHLDYINSYRNDHKPLPRCIHAW